MPKMSSFSGLGIGLSVVFGCLLLAFVAELYYLLWWKKRLVNTQIEADSDDYYSNYAKEVVDLFCGKKRPSSLENESTREISGTDSGNGNNPYGHERDLELGSNSTKDLLLKSFAEEGVEAELMRLHNLAGPPRFLFTIKEETKEDLESDDGKSRGERSRKGSRTKSLSDFIDTPFLSPLASPPLKSPLDSYSHHGFNPLFESSSEVDQMFRPSSSPPPKFKFLRDAEEKLYRRLKMEAERKGSKNHVSISVAESDAKSPKSAPIKDGSLLAFLVHRNKDEEIYHHVPQYPSSSSQVLPLATSPTAFKPLEKKPS